MDITLTINGRDFAPRLSTYEVSQEISFPDMITTIDGTEYYGKKHKRDIITFKLLPFDEETANKDYEILASDDMLVTYSNPQAPERLKIDRKMRLDSDLSAAFGLRSVDGNRYYLGGEIVLRSSKIE